MVVSTPPLSDRYRRYYWAWKRLFHIVFSLIFLSPLDLKLILQTIKVMFTGQGE